MNSRVTAVAMEASKYLNIKKVDIGSVEDYVARKPRHSTILMYYNPHKNHS